ncbi:hypothetical protein Q9L58_010096 [Maublancomyces gigas]|uniref:F-box domain-containing protein n=1 Tax=Discina gigas TaxID=1032678 RepID=A0ABR3G538_9PEZI
MAGRKSRRLAAHGADAPSKSPIPPSPCVVFPLLSLPPELTLHIASYLPACTVLALLLTSRAFQHLSTIFTILSRKNHTISSYNSSYTYSPLAFFSSLGNESVLSRLLHDGADPNEVSLAGQRGQFSPLIHGIASNNAKIVDLLIKYGAGVNRQDVIAAGYSPLEVAVMGPLNFHIHPPNHENGPDRPTEIPQIVQLLIDAGADVNDEHHRFGALLYIVCGAYDADPGIVAALIAGGANVHARYSGTEPTGLGQQPPDGHQAIHIAAIEGCPEIMQILLDAGADIEAQTGVGYKPLDMAIMGFRVDMFLALIAAGADTYTDIALCKPITTTSKELGILLADAREFAGIPNPWKMLTTGFKLPQLMRWLDLRGCRPISSNRGLWRFNTSNLPRTRSGRYHARID